MLCTVDVKAKPIQNLVITMCLSSTGILMNLTSYNSVDSVGKFSALYDNTKVTCKPLKWVTR